MRNKSASLLISLSLLLSALSILILTPSALAQTQSGRSIRTRDPKVRVGASQMEINTNSADRINLWSVIIGVSDYKFGDQDIDGSLIRNLRYADEDAKGLYQFLRSPEGGGFRDESEGGHMILLTDEDATRTNVEKALSKLKAAKPDDYFVIFIASHGMLFGRTDPRTNSSIETPYFVLYDTDLRDIERTGLSMTAFRDMIGQIPAKKGLVLSDTCHSAGVQLGGRASGQPRVNARYINEMSSIEAGIGFIWSAGQFEEALEPLYLGHGAFTYCLLEGLRGNADTNQDTKVTFNEIAEYLREEVPKITEDKQHPYYRTDTLEANYLSLSVVDYAELNPETGTGQYGTIVIRTPDLDGVEVAIDGSYYDKLDSRLQRSVKVKTGPREITFTKGEMKRTVKADVEYRKSKLIEVNLTFSQGDDDSLVGPNTKQLNVYLTEAKEPSKDAKDLFYKGVDSFNRQKFEEARDLFEKAVKANGGAYADALVYLGRAYQSLGNKQAAISSFKAALALRPSDYETQTLLAEAQFNAGYNVEDVIKQLEGILYRYPNYDYARVVYGDVLLARGDYIGAERQLRRAIDLVPTSPPAHMILAEALTFQPLKSKQKQAIESAQMALELFDRVSRKQSSPSKALKRLSISHVIFGGGRYVNLAAMAEAQYILGYALINGARLDDTGDRSEYLSRARTNIDAAMKFAEKSEETERYVQALDASAQIYLLQADPVRAIKEGEEALKMSQSPDLKGEIYLTLFYSYKSGQQYGKAADCLKQYLALSGQRLSPKERSGFQDELDLLNRKKQALRQK